MIRRRLAESEGEEAIALDQVAVLLERKAGGAEPDPPASADQGACSKSGSTSTCRVTFALIAALAAHIVSVFFYW